VRVNLLTCDSPGWDSPENWLDRENRSLCVLLY